MQAEDIIQTKEWQQLSDVEKKLVEPLASTEGEYNILKKMLLIAKQDADDVPLVSSAVQQSVHAHLHQKQPKRFEVIWYAAAASVIIIVLAYFLLLQSNKPKNKDFIVKKDQPSIQKNSVDTSTQKQLQNIQTPAPQKNDVVIDHPIDTISIDNRRPNKIQINRDNLINPNDVAINTSVNANTNLLEFVTEVY